MRNVILTIIAVITFGLSFWGFYTLLYEDNTDSYSGIITFNNQNDFVQFKQEIADKATYINKLDELNSNYPILINFSIAVNNDVDFNYGDKMTESHSIIFLPVFLLSALVTMVIIIGFIK